MVMMVLTSLNQLRDLLMWRLDWRRSELTPKVQSGLSVSAVSPLHKPFDGPSRLSARLNLSPTRTGGSPSAIATGSASHITAELEHLTSLP